MEPRLQFAADDWLLIGFCGRKEQLEAIMLCREYHGTVLFREGEVMVVEVGGEAEAIDGLLARLHGKGVTHLWRGGTVAVPAVATRQPAINFCGMKS